MNASRARIVLAVSAIAGIIPLFCARHLPMADLPEHLASMATLRHWFDPSWKVSEFYVLGGLATPYWLYHLLGAALSVVTGSAERANVVLLAITGLAYPYALAALLRALRRDERLAVFGAALFWTQNLIVGLLNFVASVPLALLGLALVARQADRPTRRRAIGLAFLAIATFYLHVSSFAMFAGGAVILTWMLGTETTIRAKLRAFSRRIVWLAPGAVIAVVVVRAGHTVASSQAGLRATWMPRRELVLSLFHWLFDDFRSPVDDVLGAILVLCLLALGAASFFGPKRVENDRVHSRATIALALGGVAFWLASPSNVGSDAFLLDVRLGVFVALFLVLLPRPRKTAFTEIALAATAATAIAYTAFTAYEVRAFERDDVAGFDEVLRGMPRGKRLVALNFDSQSTHINANVTNYFGSYYHARYGGIAAFSYSEVTHWPIRYRPEQAPPSRMLWGNPCDYQNERDGAYFDYALVRGDRAPTLAGEAGPQWSLVGLSRAWKLYKKSDAPPSFGPPGRSCM